MSDIVERLRKYPTYTTHFGDFCISIDAHEAADEIAALRKERDALKAEVWDWQQKAIKTANDAVTTASELRRYVGTEMLRSDFRTAAELRAAYEGALKSLDLAMRANDLYQRDYPRGSVLDEAEEAVANDPLCAATLARIRHEPPHP